MADSGKADKDRAKQRRVQAVTAILALIGVVSWVLGNWFGPYLAAVAIILFTVATLRWIDDKEVIEKEHEQHKIP